LDEQSGKYFDPQIVDKFQELVRQNRSMIQPITGESADSAKNLFPGEA
jgi:hypothetical protein